MPHARLLRPRASRASLRYHGGLTYCTAAMELLTTFIDIVLHLDKHLAILATDYGPWLYAILFAIIFCETGLVITPFLPGDSLLFVAGTLAATGHPHRSPPPCKAPVVPSLPN